MGEYGAVACKYWLINRTIAGILNELARCIKFNTMRAISARRLLGSALPNGQVWIRQKGIQ